MSSAHEIPHRLHFDMSDRLAKALRVAGMTNAEMAEYLGVSRNTISNWTNGHQPVKKQSLRLWALRTGVPLEWLEHGRLNAESPSGDDPKGQATPSVGAGPRCTPRDLNPEPIDYGTVIPLFERIAA